ncbi:histidine phosphatase family protein [Histidinibacterium aquaticum]|uniref:Histidine phosphatase family protein n=1 Tax=Histidinibacterium aquaticum TaxID=2613962 RepID=A0A5J5GLP7_9RHOB|nr:histidine phosphatase family protein [Histidinibacterium aquaticum]KAA9008957.1 histidine phosphatase family protein [Histidinibacterium aquaticum]
MMPPEILVIRHGETEWNRIGRWQGALDSPLTEKGRAQAHSMARALAALGIEGRTHALLHSPQGRAMATALPIAEACGLEPVPDERLREIGVGLWAGLTREEADARWPAPDPHEHFLDRYARAPEGEPFSALWARVTGLLASLDRPTVLVTHGITSRFLRTAALGLGIDRLHEVPGGQGVIFRIREGRQEVIDPASLAPGVASG